MAEAGSSKATNEQARYDGGHQRFDCPCHTLKSIGITERQARSPVAARRSHRKSDSAAASLPCHYVLLDLFRQQRNLKRLPSATPSPGFKEREKRPNPSGSSAAILSAYT